MAVAGKFSNWFASAVIKQISAENQNAENSSQNYSAWATIFFHSPVKRNVSWQNHAKKNQKNKSGETMNFQRPQIKKSPRIFWLEQEVKSQPNQAAKKQSEESEMS